MMQNDILESLKRELINGYAKKGHPFRYFGLATMNGKQPVQRTVVLRKVRSDLSLVVFTDARSEKVQQLEANNVVSALFYHPKKLLQLRIQGKVEFLDGEELERLWMSIPENSRKDYTALEAPGTPIKNPDHVDYSEENNHFKVVHIIPESIEYLRLKRPNHLRIHFSKQGDEWTGQFLTP
jgi:pyridoxamine 5'-phosphate oxidase